MAKFEIGKIIPDFRDNPKLEGVYYKDGCEYASDGHWMYKICEYYAKENEGKFLRPNGKEITYLKDGEYETKVEPPAYDKVLDRFKIERSQYELADLILKDDFENIYKHFTHYRNKTLFENHSIIIYIGSDQNYIGMNLYTLKAVLLFWRAYPKARLYANKEYDKKPFFLTDGANTCVFVTVNPDLYNGFSWTYSTKDEIVKKIA